MEEHFTTYKHHNHHHYYNIMYHDMFISNSDLNFMIISQLEKKIDERLFFVYIYINVQFVFWQFPIKRSIF